MRKTPAPVSPASTVAPRGAGASFLNGPWGGRGRWAVLLATLLVALAGLGLGGADLASDTLAFSCLRQMHQRDWTGAQQTAAQALRWNPWHSKAAFYALAALKEQGRWTQAQEKATQLLAWQSETNQILRILTQAQWVQGQAEAALQSAWEVLWETPCVDETTIGLWRLVGEASARMGQRPGRLAAAYMLTRWTQTHPDDPQANLLIKEAQQTLREEGMEGAAQLVCPAGLDTQPQTQP